MMKLRKFQLVSDVHLFGKSRTDQLFVTGEYLLVAGDLAAWGDNRDAAAGVTFLKDMCDRFTKVFYIVGNHEFYHGEFFHVLELLRGLKIANNFQFMHGDTYSEENFVLFGHPMWTDFNRYDPVAMNCARRGMNDFRLCMIGNRLWTPEDAFNQHEEGLAKLEAVCEDNADKDILVMTHHAPGKRSVDHRYKDDLLNHAYYTDLDEFILARPNIKVWVHGHMHTPQDYMVGTTRVVSNPMGYDFDYGNNFNPEFTFEI